MAGVWLLARAGRRAEHQLSKADRVLADFHARAAFGETPAPDPAIAIAQR